MAALTALSDSSGEGKILPKFLHLVKKKSKKCRITVDAVKNLQPLSLLLVPDTASYIRG